MDFTFSDEQDALRDAARSFLSNEAPGSYVRAMADDERGFTDDLWRKIADVGWPGLLVPEEHGGLGLGLVDMDVVMEEMGRLPFPGPVLLVRGPRDPRRSPSGRSRPPRAAGIGHAARHGRARRGRPR